MPLSALVTRRRFWSAMVSPVPAVLVFVLGATASVLLWMLLSMYLEAEARREAEGVADRVARLVEARRERLTQGLDEFGALVARDDERAVAAWDVGAALVLAGNPGVEALAWLLPLEASEEEAARDVGVVGEGEAVPRAPIALQRFEKPVDARADGTPVADASGAGDGEDLGRPMASGAEPIWRWLVEGAPDTVLDLLTEVEASRESRLAASRDGPDGRFTLLAAVPLGPLDEPRGTLVAVLDPERLLGPVLEEAGARHRASLLADGREVLRHVPAREVGGALGPPVDVELGLDGVVGEPLVVSVERASTRATNVDQQLGVAALASCVLASVLLGAIVHLVAVARVRARATEQAQRDLQARIHEARVAAEEVVTLNRTLEQRVRERTEGLDAAIRDLETFNASVSHDLRSPLGAILNYAAVLREDHADELGEHGQELLGRVERSARGAVGLMDALLAFSSASRQPLSPEPTDVRASVEAVVEELRLRTEGKAPRVVVGDLDDAVADPRLLHVLFTNLVGNAFKFTRGRPAPKVEVHSRRKGGHTVYWVQDNGVGFDPRLAPRVFGLFERMHRDAFEGHGVGLATVKRIVERHGGRCWAKGVPGKGAAFFFSLPDRDDGDPK
ncbi:MAG: hypothetical protein H6825_16955 [Planctomycetes bacterium]|nr:hypothetical protein [Planctomycetota bacterium]